VGGLQQPCRDRQLLLPANQTWMPRVHSSPRKQRPSMQEQAADRQSQEELVPSMLDGSPWVDVGDIRGEGEAAQPGTPNAGRGSNTTTVTEWMKILHAMADSFRCIASLQRKSHRHCTHAN